MQVTQFNSLLKLSFQTIVNQKTLYLLGNTVKSVYFFILLIVTSGPLKKRTPFFRSIVPQFSF